MSRRGNPWADILGLPFQGERPVGVAVPRALPSAGFGRGLRPRWQAGGLPLGRVGSWVATFSKNRTRIGAMNRAMEGAAPSAPRIGLGLEFDRFRRSGTLQGGLGSWVGDKRRSICAVVVAHATGPRVSPAAVRRSPCRQTHYQRVRAVCRKKSKNLFRPAGSALPSHDKKRSGLDNARADPACPLRDVSCVVSRKVIHPISP